MQTDALLNRFRADLAADPQFLQRQLRAMFLDNPHRLAFTMTPDKTYLQVRRARRLGCGGVFGLRTVGCGGGSTRAALCWLRVR